MHPVWVHSVVEWPAAPNLPRSLNRHPPRFLSYAQMLCTSPLRTRCGRCDAIENHNERRPCGTIKRKSNLKIGIRIINRKCAAAIGALDAKLVQRQLEPSPLDSQRTKIPASARAAATRAFAAGRARVGRWCRLVFRRQEQRSALHFYKQRSQKFREWAGMGFAMGHHIGRQHH